jgi:hypothetical protein
LVRETCKYSREKEEFSDAGNISGHFDQREEDDTEVLRERIEGGRSVA